MQSAPSPRAKALWSPIGMGRKCTCGRQVPESDEAGPELVLERELPTPKRWMRPREAAHYLGMDRNKFNEMVRPYLMEIPLGSQAIAFRRVDIDDWADDYEQHNGRRPKAQGPEDDLCRNVTVCQGSARKAASGKLKNAVNTRKEAGSAKARERLAALRQKKS
jgi:predicted DNA-binding transcriptional regulator AlpA